MGRLSPERWSVLSKVTEWRGGGEVGPRRWLQVPAQGWQGWEGEREGIDGLELGRWLE